MPDLRKAHGGWPLRGPKPESSRVPSGRKTGKTGEKPILVVNRPPLPGR